MELDAPDGKLLVFDAHDFAFVGFGGDFEAIGECVALDDEGMVTCGGKWIGHAFKEVFAIVFHEGSFAVHHAVVHNDVAAENVSDALMAEADSERGDLGAEGADDFVGEAGFFGGTGAGRNEDAFGFEGADLIDGNLVIAMDFHGNLHFTEILDEVVGERIVIIDDQHHGRTVIERGRVGSKSLDSAGNTHAHWRVETGKLGEVHNGSIDLLGYVSAPVDGVCGGRGGRLGAGESWAAGGVAHKYFGVCGVGDGDDCVGGVVCAERDEWSYEFMEA